MKLTLNVAEVQEAVTQHIIASGFPVDMENATIFITEGGADISFEKIETETAPKAKRKAIPKAIPKAKKPKETEAGSGVENADEDEEAVEEIAVKYEDEEEEAVEEVAVKDEPETITVEETEDLILTELDEEIEPVVNNGETGNDFSLFG